MRFVLDASVATAWFFEDESSAAADAALELMDADGEALTPLLFWFELRNAILLGIRRNRVVEERATEIFARLQHAAIGFDSIPETHDIAFALARRHHLTFYDACYLELAVREGLALATLDQALVHAARAEGVAMIGA